jgi:hypothetical protein
MTAAKNAHGVYEDREHLRLVDGKARIALVEVRVAETPGGWRATTSFAFTTGNWWGCSSPITDHDKPHASKDEAVSYAASRLVDSLSKAPAYVVEPSMSAQRSKMLAWLSGLLKREPVQLDMFA